MKVLFLDIDGVANCATTKETAGPYIGIDPKLMAKVQRIVDKTGSVVVLSSTWRLDDDLRMEVMCHIGAGCSPDQQQN